MRIILLHNKSAGSENHADDEIEASLQRQGHEVAEVVTEVKDLVGALATHACDLIVVAGGDGTVSRAACTIAGCGIPLAILPLGTANNTARSLGVEGDVDALIRGWDPERFRDFDLASVDHQGSFGLPFSEAIGWGAFPEVIARAHEMSSPEHPERTLERDRQLFRSVVEQAEPRRFELEIDGETVRGDYLLVEIVNIPFIGPRLEVSPNSDPSDGQLEVVFAGEPERDALLELAATGGVDGGAELPSRRAKRITVRTGAGSIHHDGALIRRPRRDGECTITVEPARVRYLVNSV